MQARAFRNLRAIDMMDPKREIGHWQTMNYIEQSLGTNERVVAKAHFHWWYSFKAWAALILLFWCVIGIVIFFQMMIRKWTTEIAVTSSRFVDKTGVFALHTNEISLANIEGVRVEQTFWGRIMGYGHLRIEGTGVDAVVIPDIADPIAFRRAIETAKDGAAAATIAKAVKG